MFIFPFWTTSPFHYYPIATLILIFINVVVSIAAMANPDLLELTTLSYTEITPIAWFTSFFVHGSLSHLIGNMTFLWLFGITVEGRLGFLTTMTTYLLIGVTQNVMEQGLFVGLNAFGIAEASGSLGASSAIFGLMALAFILAYDAEFKTLFLIGYYVMVYEVPISIFCLIYIFLNIAEVVLVGVGSGFLHLMGVGFGFAFGAALSSFGLIPTDGANFFAFAFGHKVERKVSTQKAMKIANERREQEAGKLREFQDAMNFVTQLIQAQKYQQAEKRMSDLVEHNPNAQWTPEIMLQIIQGHTAQKEWQKADHLISQFVQMFPNQRTVPIHLSWAHCKIMLEYPRKALRILQSLKGHPVTPEQKTVFQSLAGQARQSIINGVLEAE